MLHAIKTKVISPGQRLFAEDMKMRKNQIITMFLLLITCNILLYAGGIPQGCALAKQECVEPGGTRYINGVAAHSDCWKYRMTYTCSIAPINTCAEYEKDCSLDRVKGCSRKIGNLCVAQEFIYSCPTRFCDGESIVCGEQSFCLDGDCYEEKNTKTSPENFAQDASSFASVMEMAKAVADQNFKEGDMVTLLKGHVEDCGKAGLGLYNCCEDNGMVMHNCSAGEKKLYEARKKGVAVKAGEYCAKRILGKCVVTREGWCVFDSKLAAIIQGQGRVGQLGKSLGDGEHPDCSPLTPDELQRIDFRKLDLRSFYNDLKQSAKFPNAGAIQGRMQHNMKLKNDKFDKSEAFQDKVKQGLGK